MTTAENSSSVLVFVLIMLLMFTTYGLEVYLSLKKSLFIASIIPIFSVLLAIPAIVFMITEGFTFTTSIRPLTFMIINCIIFIWLKLLKNKKPKKEIKDNINTMQITDLGD